MLFLAEKYIKIHKQNVQQPRNANNKNKKTHIHTLLLLLFFVLISQCPISAATKKKTFFLYIYFVCSS